MDDQLDILPPPPVTAEVVRVNPGNRPEYRIYVVKDSLGLCATVYATREGRNDGWSAIGQQGAEGKPGYSRDRMIKAAWDWEGQNL